MEVAAEAVANAKRRHNVSAPRHGLQQDLIVSPEWGTPILVVVNYGPFLGTLDIRCLTRIGIQKGTMILTTTHIYIYIYMSNGQNSRMRHEEKECREM